MFEQIILGIIQGVAEWLPISSEGMIVLAKNTLFHSEQMLEETIRTALFLHLGTFFAAVIYFRKDLIHLLRSIPRLKDADESTRKTFSFLLFTTIISGSLGIILLKTVHHLTSSSSFSSQWITALVGGLLLITGFLELKAIKPGYKKDDQINITDILLLGFVQACAVLPGLSRSGLTVSTLLLRKFDKATSLRLSFLMSIPLVLAGNIILNFNAFALNLENLVGLLFAFGFGLLTIHLLLKVAEKINFGLFVIGFGILTILSVLI